MFNRVAVLSAAPIATFLALLLELLLGLGISETKEQLDAIMLVESGVELSDDSLSNLARFKSRDFS